MSLGVRTVLILLSLALCLDGLGAPRPNILFIIVDDQSPFDFGFYNPGSPWRTPNIYRLAAEGMFLDAAHHMGSWSSAVCTPSRHMIMTGRTVWHIPNGPRQTLNPHGADPARVPPGLEQYSLPAVFNRAGYATMRTCKTGNSYEAANKLFSVRRDAGKRGGTDDTGSAWHAEQVLSWLDQRAAAKDARPFLIHFGFSHPHDTRDGKQRHFAGGEQIRPAPAAVAPQLSAGPPLPAGSPRGAR